MLILFWPISIFAVIAIPEIYRKRYNPAIMFSLSWAIPTWIVYEFIANKSPISILPVLPAVSIATVISLSNVEIHGRRLVMLGATLIILVLLVITILSIVIPIHFNETISITGVVFCISGTLTSVVAAFLLISRSNPLKAVFPSILASILICSGLFGYIIGPLYHSEVQQIFFSILTTIFSSNFVFSRIESVTNHVHESFL